MNLPEEELRTDRFYAVRLAKSESFGDFVSSDDPRVEVYVRNWHFRQLANSCWSLEISNRIDEIYRFIDDMLCYFVCEYPEASVCWMRRALNWDFDRLPQENVTGDQGGLAVSLSALDDDTYSVICKKNDLDFGIYRYAVDRFLNQSYLPERPTR